MKKVTPTSKDGSITSDKINQLYDTYDTKIKVMGDYVEITTYSNLLQSLKNGAVNPFKPRSAFERKSKGTGEIRDDSLNRSFSRLMDLSLANYDQFKTFITLTFKDNVTDLTFANDKFRYWTSNVRKIYPNFKYLGVPEFQKRGAVHYHLMTNLSIDDNIITVQKDKFKMYDIKYWNHGFSSVFDLALTDDKFSVSLYLSKYFYKDIDNRLFGRRKILASQNLKEPDVYKFNSKEVEKINKFVESKQKVKDKTIVPKSQFAPDVINIKTYKKT